MLPPPTQFRYPMLAVHRFIRNMEIEIRFRIGTWEKLRKFSIGGYGFPDLHKLRVYAPINACSMAFFLPSIQSSVDPGAVIEFPVKVLVVEIMVYSCPLNHGEGDDARDLIFRKLKIMNSSEVMEPRENWEYPTSEYDSISIRTSEC